MSIFEIQMLSDGRWKSTDAFVDYESAYESAGRIERVQQPEHLRICRIDMGKFGVPRETTLYEGGLKVSRERAAQRKKHDQDVYRQRIVDRREQRVAAENAELSKKQLFSSNSPIYLTLVALTIGLTGLSALYLVEKLFTS